MNNEPIEPMIQQGNIMRIENALVEEVVTSDRSSSVGYLIVSYSLENDRRRPASVQNLRLNVNRNTIILNAFGRSMRLSDIRKGMRIHAVFSSFMTRSIPPQSNAFLIIVQKSASVPSTQITTDRVVWVDSANQMLYTGNPEDMNRQRRFSLQDAVIRDSNGNIVRMRALRPGQLVRITHADFQTASIPPQSVASEVQILE